MLLVIHARTSNASPPEFTRCSLGLLALTVGRSADQITTEVCGVLAAFSSRTADIQRLLLIERTRQHDVPKRA